MPGVDGGFYPPVQFQPWWGLIGAGILLVLVAWYVFVFVSTRRREVPPALPDPEYRPQPAQVREHYATMITQTQAAYASGELDSREAHHQLSLLLRSFVTEREGIPTMHMTLADLRRTDLVPLSGAVERLYPGAFNPNYTGSVDEAAAEARRLVSQWR
ncbi:MAG: hypothetical protein ACOH19_03955 [Rhodoglobus sp.]